MGVRDEQPIEEPLDSRGVLMGMPVVMRMPMISMGVVMRVIVVSGMTVVMRVIVVSGMTVVMRVIVVSGMTVVMVWVMVMAVFDVVAVTVRTGVPVMRVVGGAQCCSALSVWWWRGMPPRECSA
jgi:hypothetical protein